MHRRCGHCAQTMMMMRKIVANIRRNERPMTVAAAEYLFEWDRCRHYHFPEIQLRKAFEFVAVVLVEYSDLSKCSSRVLYESNCL